MPLQLPSQAGNHLESEAGTGLMNLEAVWQTEPFYG